MQLPTRYKFDALVFSSQIPSDDPHHLLERSQLGATADLQCYPEDSELFQVKAKFTYGNKEHVILISSSNPLFDVSHHFVLHTQQGCQDAASSPPPNSNAEGANDNPSNSNHPPDSNPEDANDSTGGTNDGSLHIGAFDEMPLTKHLWLPPSLPK